MKPTELNTPDRVVLLFSLVPYLIEHGPTQVSELAEAFDTNPATLRSLISFLGMAGVPGETATYQDEDLFDIDWQAFEEHDTVSLTRTVAVQDTPRFSGIEAAALLAGVHALGPMLPASQQQVIESLRDKLRAASATVGAEPAVSVAPERSAPVVNTIAQALSMTQQLTFGYLDAQSAFTMRRVDPLLLHQQGEHWYLRAWCHERHAERTFAVDRMRDVHPSELPATHVGSYETARTAPLRFENFGEGAVRAVVRVTERAAAALVGFSPVRVTAVDDAGWLTVEIMLAHPDIAIRLVQTLPGEVQVLSPSAAIRAVSEWTQLALVGYDE